MPSVDSASSVCVCIAVVVVVVRKRHYQRHLVITVYASSSYPVHEK